MTSLESIFPPEAIEFEKSIENLQTLLLNAQTDDDVSHLLDYLKQNQHFLSTSLDSLAANLYNTARCRAKVIPYLAKAVHQIVQQFPSISSALKSAILDKLFFGYSTFAHLCFIRSMVHLNIYSEDEILAYTKKVVHVYDKYCHHTYASQIWFADILMKKDPKFFTDIFDSLHNMRIYDDVTEEFNIYVDKKDELFANDFKLLREYLDIGYLKNSIEEAIINDDLDKLKNEFGMNDSTALAGTLLNQSLIPQNPFDHSNFGVYRTSYLDLAATYGSERVFEYFASFVDLSNLPHNEQVLILRRIIYGGSLHIFQMFIEKTRLPLETGIYDSINFHRFNIFQYIFDHSSISVDYKVEFNREPMIFSAAENNNLAVLIFLIENGVGINSRNEQNKTPLYVALSNGNRDVFSFLYSAKTIDLNIPTIAHLFAQHNEFDKFKKLLNDSPELLNSHNSYEMTPFMVAVESQHKEIVDYILATFYQSPEKAKKELAIIDLNQRNILHIAAKTGNLPIFEELYGLHLVDVNQGELNGSSPLQIAINAHNDDIIRFLITKDDVDINKADRNGDTPLILTIYYGKLDIIKLFLDAPKIEINKLNPENGEPPIYEAVCSGNIEIVKMFLQAKGLDLSYKTAEGQTLKDKAIEYDYNDIAALLP